MLTIWCDLTVCLVVLDVSTDLMELSRTPVAVICAGIKSILDIPRTLEYLETHVWLALFSIALIFAVIWLTCRMTGCGCLCN